MDSFTEAWGLVCEYCKSKITEVAYTTWISRIEPVSLDFTSGTAVLKVPNDFHRKTIMHYYLDTIQEAFLQIFGTSDIKIDLRTDDELTPQKPVEDKPSAEDYEYTFDTFIVGPSNKFAHAASMAVATKPAELYNPLFIYGNSGLGKTHLLYAICNEIKKNSPDMDIVYIKGDEFTNELISAIQKGTTAEFHNRYRNADVLLVDDIQFIAGKIGVQEEFFHTFNNLYEAGKQIVITSDRPPIEMVQLEDRLRTRFEGGLMADIQPPDMETRMAIIRNKASQLGMLLPDDVVDYIADTIKSNIRQIEGVVKRLTAYNSIMNDEININAAKRAIKDVIRVGEYVPTPDVIIEETARYYSLDPEDLRGQRRTKNTAMARQISMYLMRELTNMSLKDIGEQYENRNHTTVLSSIRKVEDLISHDPAVSATVRDITSNINASHGQ